MSNHEPSKTASLAVELQQFLDDTMQGATDEVGDAVNLNEEGNPETSFNFEVRKDGLCYDIHIIPKAELNTDLSEPETETETEEAPVE